MSAVSVNPLGPQGDFTERSEKPKSFMERYGTAAKVLLSVGVVACVGVAGYVAGSSTSGSGDEGVVAAGPDSTVDDTASDNAVSQARDSLHGAFVDSSNPALNGTVSISDMNLLIDEYEANPSAWDDQFLTADIMAALKTLRDDQTGQVSARRLRSDERELIGSYDEPFVNAAWEAIEDETYSGGVAVGEDQFQVKRATIQGVSGCWVIAQETNSAADWANNINFGSEDVQSLKKYTIQDESCGCDKKTLWWCSRYKTCSTYKTLGTGFDGFIQGYNAARLQVKSLVDSRCSTSDNLIVVGYSRGAGLLAPFAGAMYLEGLWSASKIKMVTFGEPRSVDDELSDKLHNKFTKWRMVNANDLVASIPFDWFGVKHFGTLRCLNCNYAEERDRPFYAWDIGDHTSYCQFFGDSAC